MKFVAKLSDGQFLEIGIREIDAEESAEADEVVSLAEQKKSGGRLRRLMALGIVAAGAVAVSRRLRGGKGAAMDEEAIESEQQEPIEIEAE